MFALGLSVFTLGSVAAALAPSVEALNVARAVQGLGGAIVMPLTLTLLSAAVPPEKRGLALGAWGGIGGLAIAFGPLVGGAVVRGDRLAVDLLAERADRPRPRARSRCARLEESHGPAGRLDLPGLALASAGLFGIVWGLVRGNAQGWASAEIVGSLARRRRPRRRVRRLGAAGECADAADAVLPLAYVRARERRVAVLMFFGMFGSIFLLAQFFQTVQGYSPLGAGLRILPWTLAPMFIAPVAGALSDRISRRS